MPKNRFIAFIPVRGGSKSIPRKNIKDFCGKPLVYWTIKAASETQKIDEIFVATEDAEIKKVVENFKIPKVKVTGRSAETIKDTSSTESSMLEFAKKHEFENIILIQATSPLLESADLQKGINTFMKSRSDSLLSVVRQKRFLWEKKGKSFSPVNYNFEKRPRRQEFDGFLVENGAFYITSRKNLLKTKCRLSGNISVHEMNESSYFEIDELSDWIIAEGLKKGKIQNNSQKIDFSKINLLISDVDGVLTDGGMYYTKQGEVMKKFNTIDGKGIELLRDKGIETMFLTGENTDIVRKRAEKLKIKFLFMGIKNKAEFLKKFFKENPKYNFGKTAYIGDDLNDVESLKLAYLSCAPFDASKEAKNIVKYNCMAKGGTGCVREVCNMILNGK
jgi:YrbI family 3-deoxy-D-manno-octulosonate 8-phosphate phosphatase